MAKAKQLTIECRTCKGSGEEKLAEIYARTLELVEFDWQATSEILDKARGSKAAPVDVKNTALCNRLAYLEFVGLVASRRSPARASVKEWKRL